MESTPTIPSENGERRTEGIKIEGEGYWLASCAHKRPIARCSGSCIASGASVEAIRGRGRVTTYRTW